MAWHTLVYGLTSRSIRCRCDKVCSVTRIQTTRGFIYMPRLDTLQLYGERIVARCSEELCGAAR